MLVPAIEVQIGEKKDHEARRQEDFGSRSPYSLVAGGYADELGKKAEIDADIGKYRPGERRRRRQH
ncbi:hypothetical protein D3C86_2243690 [compost metagenome]